MKVQVINVDLYNHFFSNPQIIEGEDVVDCVMKYYDEKDPEIAQEVKNDLIKKLAANNHQDEGLATNRDSGWRISGEEELILIIPIE